MVVTRRAAKLPFLYATPLRFVADYEPDATPLRFVADYEPDATPLRFVADYEPDA